MEREDFTFPVTTNNDNTKVSIDSMPWWCVTHSSSSSEKSENKEDDDFLECSAASGPASCCGRKSFEVMKSGATVGNVEDNMDLLWEDFNEETMCRISRGLHAEPDVSSRRIAGLGCTGAFKLVKAEGGRNPSAGVFIKVFKKLLPHKTRPPSLRSTR